MKLESLQEKLSRLVSGILGEQGYELISVTAGGRKGNRTVRFTVDRDGGINVDDCARISRELSDVLEFHEEDLGLDRYRLEVSSPGIDRPLRTEQDFRRNRGRRVTVSYLEEGAGKTLEGRIADVRPTAVVVETDDLRVSVPLASVQSARIKPEW